MSATRKIVCVRYQTGKNVKRNGRIYPETKLLSVGSAFEDDESGCINGTFLAVPPHWDGTFAIMPPFKRQAQIDGPDHPPEDIVDTGIESA